MSASHTGEFSTSVAILSLQKQPLEHTVQEAVWDVSWYECNE